MRLTNTASDVHIQFDFAKGTIASLAYQDMEILAKESELFSVRLTDRHGNIVCYSSTQARLSEFIEGAQIKAV